MGKQKETRGDKRARASGSVVLAGDNSKHSKPAEPGKECAEPQFGKNRKLRIIHRLDSDGQAAFDLRIFDRTGSLFFPTKLGFTLTLEDLKRLAIAIDDVVEQVSP